MFIHLDLGWMSHPFPLSSFKLSSDDQLVTLRRLGLAQVRWNPEKSDMALDDGTPAGAVPDAGDGATADDGATTPSAEDLAREAHRLALAAQREALLLCERQYGEAANAFRDLMDLLPRDARGTRDQAIALASAMLDKMLVEGDLNIRLLNEGAGDRSTAHALNVSIISLLLGRAFGLGRDEMMDLGVGALLHDVGKTEVLARLRHRDDSFTAVEVQAYQQHVAKGVALAQNMGV